jgi:hypothetical protein
MPSMSWLGYESAPRSVQRICLGAANFATMDSLQVV